MFKKLKEKITEEVKISPQRFQQLTQSVSDALGQGSQGQTADDNLFSIGDDDANTPTATSPDKGFSSVNLVSPSSEKQRKMSTSSMASDVSFLPRYEFNNSSYHLQSDLDASASEFEDNVSTSSSAQIGHLTKEQIYAAFQKSQTKYHKYRGRFTDLARHYKDLERENAKMKSVLVETQDKAIRRVTELKEQCALEQKAKAHLEGALRDELDEKQFKIQALQTKIGALQGVQTGQLVEIDKNEAENENSEKLETLTKYLNDARSEIEALNEKIQEQKANVIIFQTKERDYKDKISKLEKELENSTEREKENNLRLAENKMEIHNELLHKDAEIDKLKSEIESLKQSLTSYEKEGSKNTSNKLENLQTQNTKLIEKIENLTQKCNGLENELLKVEKYKMDIKDLTAKNFELKKQLEDVNNGKQKLEDSNNVLKTVVTNLKQGLATCQENIKMLSDEKVKLVEDISKEKKDYENHIEKLRDSAKKGLFTLEKQILSRLERDFGDREEKLKEDFRIKLEEISGNNKSINDMHLEIVEKESVIKKMAEDIYTIQQEIQHKNAKYNELEANHLELIEESSKFRSVISDLENQISTFNREDNKVYEGKIKRLQANIKTLQEDIEKLHEKNREKEEEYVKLSQDILNIEKNNKELIEKVRLLEQKDEIKEIENTECDLLELKLQKLEEEKQTLLSNFEEERRMFNQILNENKELKIKEERIATLEETNKKLDEKVLRLKEYLKEKENTIVEINKIKLSLEQELAKVQENFRIYEEKLEAKELDKTECNLLQIKVKQLENEKENLIKAFEVERKTFDEALQRHSVDNTEVTVKKSELQGENILLAKENLELKKSSKDLYHKLRILEEQSQILDLEKSESGILKLKVQELEDERERLIAEFEMERELFNKVIISHEDFKFKDQTIEDLENSNKNLTEKVAQLKIYLNERENFIVQLQKEKLTLENEIKHVTEKLRILEEKSEALELDKSQSNILELKMQALEREKDNLIAEIESERKTFEETLKKRHHEKVRIEELSNEILELRQNLAEAQKTKEDILANLGDEMSKINDKNKKLNELLKDELEKQKSNEDKLNTCSEKFSKTTDELNNQIKERTDELIKTGEILLKTTDDLNKAREERSKLKVRLKEELQKVKRISEDLQNSNEQNRHLQEVLNKIQVEKVENIKIQEDLNSKLRDTEAELSETNLRIEEMNSVLQKSEKSKSIATKLQEKIYDLQNEKESFQDKLQELESRIQEERNTLGSEIKELHSTIEKLNKKINDLENEKTVLLNEKVDSEKALKLIFKEKEALYIKTQTLEKEKSILEKEKLELETKIQDLELRLQKNSVNIEKIGQLENKNQALLNEKTELETKLKELKRSLEENGVHVKNLEVLENEKQSLQIEKAELEKSLKKKAIELKSKLRDTQNLEREYQSVNETKHSLEDEVKELMEKVQELTQENQNLQSMASKAKDSDQLKKQNEALQKKYDKLQQEVSELQIRINQLSSDNSHLNEEQERLLSELSEHKTKAEFLEEEKNEFDKIKLQLEQENQSLKSLNLELNEKLDISSQKIQDLRQHSEVESVRSSNELDLAKIQQDFYEIKGKCDNLFIENKNLKAEYTKLEEQCNNFGKIKKDLETQLSELENHYSEVQHEKQLLQDEINELKISPINIKNSSSGKNLDGLAIIRHENALSVANGTVGGNNGQLEKEVENLKDKLHHYKSLDITNKSSIDFYENELHKMKVKNEKLGRQLDETLVTLSHVNELSHSTEIEYLRNVLYNYMLGKESMVLAKVIAAVCKFDDSQTEAVLQKEQQRQTLLGQLGIL